MATRAIDIGLLAYQRRDGITLRVRSHAALERHPFTRGGDVDRCIGQALVGNDGGADPFVDFAVAFVGATRLAGSFERATRSALGARGSP